MAHIKKLNTGKFKAIIETGKTGQRKRRTKTFDEKRKAESWIATLITEQNQGIYVNPTEMTLSEWMYRYLFKHKKPNLATTTYDTYMSRFEAYIKEDIGQLPLQRITSFHIEDFLARLRENGSIRNKGGLSENTLKKIYVLLNQTLKKADQLNLIKINPCNSIDSPQPKKKEAVAMSEDELNKLLETVKENDKFIYVFIKFAVNTGMRKSEILGLEWPDLDLKRGVVNIKKRLIVKHGEGIKHERGTKNESSKRQIKISSKIISLLKDHKKRQLEYQLQLGKEYYNNKDFIFCRPDGKPYYPTTINNFVNKAYKKANLSDEYNTHTLRHTFATLALRHNVPIEIVKDMLGHSKVSTTDSIYNHNDTEVHKKANDIMDNIIHA